uniref:Uncharacterized protein n=1 Tax=Lepeophtheirus salmonis TaxID=72036 RepID=A0A0K2TNC1_LEPSM
MALLQKYDPCICHHHMRGELRPTERLSLDNKYYNIIIQVSFKWFHFLLKLLSSRKS